MCYFHINGFGSIFTIKLFKILEKKGGVLSLSRGGSRGWGLGGPPNFIKRGKKRRAHVPKYTACFNTCT